jgi:hypothetical protein
MDLTSGLEVGQVVAVTAQGVGGLAGPGVLAGPVLEQSQGRRGFGDLERQKREESSLTGWRGGSPEFR